MKPMVFPHWAAIRSWIARCPGVSADVLDWSTRYDHLPASVELAELFDIDQGAGLLRRTGTAIEPATGRRALFAVSYVPHSVIGDLFEAPSDTEQALPQTTMYHLFSAGIEVGRVVDQATAKAASTPVAQLWHLDAGVPIWQIRSLTYDTDERLVEVCDHEYPADRVTLEFSTALRAHAARLGPEDQR